MKVQDFLPVQKWICSTIENQGCSDQARKMKYCNSKMYKGVWESMPKGYFCNNRFCILCQIRKQKNAFIKCRHIFKKVMEEKKDVAVAKLTLTVRDCYIEETSEKIAEMQHAWEKITKRRWFGRCIIGWTKILEISATLKGNRFMLHPHFHAVIFFANKSTMQEKNDAWWAKEWRECLRAEYETDVQIREVSECYRDKKAPVNENAAYYIKYALKVPEYIFEVQRLITEYAFIRLYNQLNGKKQISNGGIVRKVGKTIRDNIKAKKIEGMLRKKS